jgi:hypothetical protein
MDFRLLGPLEVTATVGCSSSAQSEGTRAPGSPAAACEPGGLFRCAGRPALGRRPARNRRQGSPGLRISAAEGARSRRPRHQGTGYFVRVAPGQLDLHRFEELVTQAQGAEPATASVLLREALSMWRGAPLADFAYETFAQAEIARLEELSARRHRAARRRGLSRSAASPSSLPRSSDS